MPAFILLLLKIVFLAVLYVFIWRAFRTVVVGVREQPTVTVAPRPPAPRAARGAPTVASARGATPSTLVVHGEDGRSMGTHRLDGTIEIGRGDNCDIRVSDTYVSSVHARVYRRDGSWFVEDLGSRNGTFVNERRISAPVELRAGDRVRMGKTTLEARA